MLMIIACVMTDVYCFHGCYTFMGSSFQVRVLPSRSFLIVPWESLTNCWVPRAFQNVVLLCGLESKVTSVPFLSTANHAMIVGCFND